MLIKEILNDAKNPFDFDVLTCLVAGILCYFKKS